MSYHKKITLLCYSFGKSFIHKGIINSFKECPVCGSTKIFKLLAPERKNGFLIIFKCVGESTKNKRRCEGKGYEWGIEEKNQRNI